MINYFPFIYFLFKHYGFQVKAEQQFPNFDIGFKKVKVDIDHNSIPSNTVAVVNNLDSSNELHPYTRYTIFNRDTVEFFTADPVCFGNRKMIVKGEAMKMEYVYDVYTYWDSDTILAVGFRWHLGGKDSLYKYYFKDKSEWKLHDSRADEGNSSGFMDNNNLIKFLDQVKTSRLKRHTEKEQYSSKAAAILLLATVGTIFTICTIGIFILKS